MIWECGLKDAPRMFFIINEAAKAYAGVIAEDRYHQPYMPLAELEPEMKRMTFYGWAEKGGLVGPAW